ncbi:MAG: tetratricopeptide repeat protein [Leptolyngbyaceae cyanobacterium bins.349]|nr:tetratricopeptide repeat protein [Leptolyngbyaceae cyanobacterium bins.349]
MTQEFHLSVTPIRDHDYLVRTEHVAPGVPLAEEQVTWYVDDWLTEASLLMGDPIMGLLRSTGAAQSSWNDRAATSSNTDSPNLVAFGQRLFNALFQRTIRDSWMMAQGIAQHQHHRLRFRLGLKGTQLHRLPWEVMYAGDRPLATGTDVIFSRYHSSFSVLKSHLILPKANVGEANQPLKILLVLAAPSDQDSLALKQEADQLRQELQSAAGDTAQTAAIELTILQQPGREDLTQALEHQHFHVLHYAGHSDLGEAGGSLYLVNRRTGLTEVMSGEDLAGLLVNNGIRMAVFNSCRGVYTATAANGQSGDGNLAESLVRRGIPAVLAMAEQIPDNVALNLSRLFYRNLKQAYPLDLSLSRTRQGLISSYGSDKLYWALPILYLHPEFDGFLQPSSSPSPASGGTFSPGYGDFYVSSDLPSFAFEEMAPSAEASLEWQTQQPNAPEPAERSLTNADLPDFDALEFDDPDPPEEEQVARLVHELSHSPTLLEPEEPILPAPPTENLLPRSPFNGKSARVQTVASARPQPPIKPQETENGHAARVHPAPSQGASRPLSPAGDTRVYSELAAVLADMGTLTEAIAASNRAVQQNPDDAEAYTNLGWALYQQGYLTEAISAYNQAIRLNPTSANAFNRLGLAFLQQGKVDEAVRAYQQAVKLDPTLTEASTNLRNALSEAPQPLVTPVPRPTPTPTPAQASLHRKKPSRRLWLWGGAGAIALAALLGGWVYREPLTKWLTPAPTVPNPTQPTSSPPPNLLNTLNSKALGTLAIEQARQGKLPETQAAIAALLEKPNSAPEVDRVLQTLPSEVLNQPAIAFLKGRWLWQKRLAGDSSVNLDTVRDLWAQAAQAIPQAHNAIGFAYYTQGRVERAEEAWLTALRSAGMRVTATEPLPQITTPANPELLTAYAGLALAAFKLSDQKPLTEQASLREAALKRREIVLQGDRANFSPEALGKNWMWSETAVEDWRKLLNL